MKNLISLVSLHETEGDMNREPPTPAELRFKKLYEYSQKYKDTKLQNALGIITTDYIDDKTALPLSIYRIKKVVEDIRSRSGHEIEKLEQQFAGHLGNELNQQVLDYISVRKAIKKTASAHKPPVFRRVSVK